jgi:uncharacterized protein (TIGR00369 family)
MTERSRTVSWHDPLETAARLPDLSGIEFMRAIVSGELAAPPMAVLMNMRPTRVEEGLIEFECEPDESHYNPLGIVHGGYACTVLDTVAGCATQTTLRQGLGYTSLEIKVNYLRALSTGSGVLTATGRVTKPGNRVAFAEATLADADGRLIATASSTLFVFPLP